MTQTTHSRPAGAETKAPLDISEKGAPKDGVPQVLNRRLYLQLQVFTGAGSLTGLIEALKSANWEGVLYQDLNDPKGVALLSFSEDPAFFTGAARELLQNEPFTSLQHRPEMTMTGRTYSMGREQDLEDWLIHKPKRNALNADWPWAVWYPLRRKPEFALLDRAEQGKVLMEHAMTGMAYAKEGHAFDIRLACHGLDTHDNEFVLGIVGPELYPLSRLVQEMRKSQQTAKYIQSLGPFFVGRVCWQSAFKKPLGA